MRLCRKSTPFFTLISFTFSRYWGRREGAHCCSHVTGSALLTGRGAHLAHLQLKEAALLLHFLCNLAAAELGANHPMLPGVFPLLLLDLCPARVRGQRSGAGRTASDGQVSLMRADLTVWPRNPSRISQTASSDPGSRGHMVNGDQSAGFIGNTIRGAAEGRRNTHPLDPLQVPLQQTVQGEADDVVHVLHLQTGSCCELRWSTCRRR